MSVPKVEKAGDGIPEDDVQEQRRRIVEVRRILRMGFAGETPMLPKSMRDEMTKLVDDLDDAIGTLTMGQFEAQKQVIMRSILKNTRNSQ